MADSRIAAVLAADDHFSRPLAATVRSLVSQLSPGRGLDLGQGSVDRAFHHRGEGVELRVHTPFRDEWFANLDQTLYRGWRPSRSGYLAGQARKLGKRVKDQLRPRAG